MWDVSARFIRLALFARSTLPECCPLLFRLFYPSDYADGPSTRNDGPSTRNNDGSLLAICHRFVANSGVAQAAPSLLNSERVARLSF